jgi:hypothetical protein
VRTVLTRNFAAGGLVREFERIVEGPVSGTLEVRNGPLPWCVLGRSRTEPLVSGARVRRGFLDASFELAVLPKEHVRIAVR